VVGMGIVRGIHKQKGQARMKKVMAAAVIVAMAAALANAGEPVTTQYVARVSVIVKDAKGKVVKTDNKAFVHTKDQFAKALQAKRAPATNATAAAQGALTSKTMTPSSPYHSADWMSGVNDETGMPYLGGDWKIDADELGRVLELYYGNGDWKYHADPYFGTENALGWDGYAPGQP